MAEGTKFPILPSSFRLKGEMNNTEVNVNSLGTVNLLGKRGLLEIGFEAFFPKQNYSFCKCAPLAPYSYCGALQERMQRRILQCSIWKTICMRIHRMKSILF